MSRSFRIVNEVYVIHIGVVLIPLLPEDRDMKMFFYLPVYAFYKVCISNTKKSVDERLGEQKSGRFE